ncbi:hypothetical protein DFW101_3525 [Solidesulfovibrio carbinoliphilus subsp. oakridgensis]|uniref:Uncharacterized protein n=1 Tax=Solidesulfovibrio carbinoliphilus subsp. oakridgensis TaxID=694327 RepID=G7QC75_9BACT|nr:hypothetical protein DFW101_3525 [Solidesulfovibrio carbinoliphilus subsp. oakridgensis]
MLDREPVYLDPAEDMTVCWARAKSHRWCVGCGTVFTVSVLGALAGRGRCPWCGSGETRAMQEVGR